MNTNHFFRSIIESLPELIVVATPVSDQETGETDFLIEYVNAAWEVISGSRCETILGKILSHTIYGKSTIPWQELGKEVLKSKRPVHCEHFSELVEKWLDITLIKLEGNHVCLNITDITELKQSEVRLKQQNMRLSSLSSELATSKNNLKIKLDKIETLNANLEQLAYYDRLTELPNRTKFNSMLKDILCQAKHGETRFALAIFDIDNLKTLNDSLGYDAGDELIRQIAMRLNLFRKDGVLASRFGGDEFLLIMNHYDHDAELLYLINGIQESLREPYSLMSTEVKSSVSIGVATFPEDADTMHNLLKYADIALTDAKRRGKNTLSFFHTIMQETLLQRINLEQKLFRAMENEELSCTTSPSLMWEPASFAASKPWPAGMTWNWVQSVRTGSYRSRKKPGSSSPSANGSCATPALRFRNGNRYTVLTEFFRSIFHQSSSNTRTFWTACARFWPIPAYHRVLWSSK